MPEQKPNSEQKAETLDSSSPNSTNTHVVGSQSNGTPLEIFYKTGNVYHKSLLNHGLESPNLAL